VINMMEDAISPDRVFVRPRDASIAAAAPAFGRAVRGEEVDVPWHAHRRPRLVLAREGAVRIWTRQSILVLPPACAAWIPAGLRHALTSERPVLLDVLSFPHDGSAPGEDARVELIEASPLLREMCAQAAAWGPQPPDPDLAVAFFATLRGLLRGWLETPVNISLPAPQSSPLKRALNHLLDRLDKPVGLPDAAQAGKMSERTLQRRCRSELETSLSSWLTRARILASLELLTDEELPIAEVARRCGYNSPAAFTRAFSQHLGHTPSAWRQRSRP
jgi:AraC-like DNA-binding protein